MYVCSYRNVNTSDHVHIINLYIEIYSLLYFPDYEAMEHFTLKTCT